MNASQRLYLIDGMALLFRSFYAMERANLKTPDGRPVGAVFGFTKILVKILQERKPSHLAVLWDTREKTFRHQIFPAYKANRSEPPAEIIPQIGMIQELMRDLAIPSFSMPGFEADDLVGTLATQGKSWADVFIVSADKDFMQLVDQRVSLFSLKKGDDYVLVDSQGVEDHFGVPPAKVIDVLAIMGDTADNVPGVKGIGAKGAAKLISEFGSLEGVYENLTRMSGKKQKDYLETYREEAFLSKKLVIIDTDVPLNVTQSDLLYSYESLLGQPKLKIMLSELGMHSILRSLVGDGAAFSSSVAHRSGTGSLSGHLVSQDSAATLFPPEDPAEQEAAALSDRLSLWGKRNYRCVKTRAELADLCSRLASEQTSVVAFDTETTGLDIITDVPIGFSFAFAKGEAYYVPACESHLSQITGSAPEERFSVEDVLAGLRQAFKERQGLLVAHNAKYDIHMLQNVAIDTTEAQIACSMVAGWIVNPQEGGYGLDAQSQKRLGLTKIPTSELIGKKAGRASMREVPLDDIAEYACEDVDATYRLWLLFEPEMRELSLHALFWEMEMPLLRVLVEMERTGVYVNATVLAELTETLQARLVELESEIFERAGESFKVSSPKQLGQILFEKVRVHEAIGYKGKLARTSLGFKTDAAVLETFSAHPLVQCVQEFRELSKLLSTYVLVLPQLIKETTGRIHTSYHQIGTATGRLSSSDPNLQNIPVRGEWGKRVRSAFSAQSPDSVILALDYSQIELRILAHLSGDPTMIAAFRSGQDIHRETAARIQNRLPSDVTAEERSAAKAINFGIIYGMGPQRLAREQGISVAQARAFIEKYFLNFSRIRVFLDSCKEFAHAHGFIKTAFGRRRPLPQLSSSRPLEQRQAENMAINSPIQGTAADIMKLGMLAVSRVLKREAPECKMVLQVHDELVFECPRAEVARISDLVQNELQQVVDYSVPLIVDVGMGESWLEAK